MSDEIIIPENQPNEIMLHNEDTLGRVVRKALKKIEDILDEKHPEGGVSVKLLSIQKDAATAIINAGLKADENRFRRENKDIIERLFDKIKKGDKIIEGRVTKRE